MLVDDSTSAEDERTGAILPPLPCRGARAGTCRRARPADCRSRSCASRRLRSGGARSSSWPRSAGGSRRSSSSTTGGRCSRPSCRRRARSWPVDARAPLHRARPGAGVHQLGARRLGVVVGAARVDRVLDQRHLPLAVGIERRALDRACRRATRSAAPVLGAQQGQVGARRAARRGREVRSVGIARRRCRGNRRSRSRSPRRPRRR